MDASDTFRPFSTGDAKSGIATIRQAILLQAARSPGGPGVSESNAGLQELIERTGIIYPRADAYVELAEREVGARALLQVLGAGAMAIADLAEKLESTQRDVRAWGKFLQDAGLVKIEGKNVRGVKGNTRRAP